MRVILAKLRALLRGSALDREMDEELRAHLERETERNIARGMDPDEAWYAAQRAFGGVDQMMERERDARGGRWLEDGVRDIRQAARALGKSPGFTTTAVLTLALGIGATAAVLCWMRNLVERPLPGVADQQDLVMLVSNQGGGNVSRPDLQDFVAQTGVFSGALVTMPTPASLTVGEHTEWIQAQVISASAFEVLGVKPIVGRTFRPDEDAKPGGDAVLVISERLWRRQFGGDPEVVGRVVELNRHPFTIIGVAPGAFLGTMAPSICDVWAPASMIWEVRNQSTGFLDRRSWRGWLNLARLRPGVSLDEARAAVDTVNARLCADHPKTNRDVRHRLETLAGCPWSAAAIVGPVLRMLLVVCACVLLIVAANIANLLLARAVDRRKEIAVRIAAGAGRGRLLRQFLTESIFLALIGGAAGLLFAAWAVNALPYLLPEPPTNAALAFHLDARTLGLTLALTLATGVIFGLLPAWQVSGLNLNNVLKEGGRGPAGGPTHRHARRLLVVLEVALALVLVIGAALCVQGLDRARRVDFGFEPDGVLIAGLQIGMNGYTRETGPKFYQQVRERIMRLPGVQEASLASWFPLGLAGCKGTGVQVDGYERPGDEDGTYEFAIVAPRYFAAMRIPLLAGRDFTDQDETAAPPVAIVNETFAQRFWPGQDPIGRTFRNGNRVTTIVGLAKAGKYNRLNETPRCFLYLPYQQGVPDLDLGLCVRFATAPSESGRQDGYSAAMPANRIEGLATTLRQAVREVDPAVDLLGVKPLALHVEAVFVAQRMASLLLSGLGVVALVLAAMGVYAVMSYAVGQRTQEFGVRMALGASPGDVLRLVLRQSLGLAALGIVAGLAMAAALTRLIAGFLFGVSPFDPVSFVGAPMLLALVAVLACYVPARRATRANPIDALRAE